MSTRNAPIAPCARTCSFRTAARRARLLMLAVAPVAAVLASPAFAANLTFDATISNTGSDGSNSWDLSTNDWFNGTSDVLWNNTGTTAVFGSGGTAGTVTLNANINAAGLTFNTVTGGYIIAATGANTLTLTAPTITVAAGQTPTISAPITGSVGLTLAGQTTGNLTLSGTNTYTGTTTIAGTLISNGTLGANTNALVFGTTGFTTSVAGNLVANANLTVGSITSSTLTSGATVVVNNLTIASGVTLNDTGAFNIGINSVDGTNISNTSLTATGAGTLNVSPTANTNFQVGGFGATSNTNANTTSTVNLSGLANFVYNTGATGTGNLNVGTGAKTLSRLLLAVNSTITANNVVVGDSQGGNNGGASNFTLGNGTNIINVNNVIIGSGKETGTFNFPTAAGASLLLNGQAGGSSTANITIGNANSGSGTGTSTMLLAGHSATVQANNVIVGLLAGATNGAGNGTLTFDTGTFNIANLQIATASSGSSAAAAGPGGSVTIGGAAPNTTATGVFNVSGAFLLGNNTLGTAATNTATITSRANFTINGGTVNLNSNVQVVGQATTFFTLAGGTLDMHGFQINGAAAAGQVNTVALPAAGQTATLKNLGGTGINGAGLSSGAGILILDGSNTYTGPTVITGTVQVGTGSTTGTLGVGNVTNNGNLTFNRTSTYSTSDNITGPGNISQVGTGAIVLAGTNANAGTVSISNGTLVATGSFGPISMTSGGLHPGTTASDGSVSTLTTTGLTTTGGDLRFDIGVTSDLITDSGAATFTGTTLSVATAGAVSAGNYTLITSTGLSGLPTLTTTTIGRSNLSLAASGNNVVLSVIGSAASLKWNGINGNVWNAADPGSTGGTPAANFLNGAAQDVFFSGDAVTFDNSNTGATNVFIPADVQPSSVTVAGTQNYSFNDHAIAGATGLSKSGAGNLTLNNANTFTGATSITGGNVTIASGGAIASSVISVGSGSTLTVAVGGNITVSPALTDNGTITLNNPARTLSTLTGSGTLNLNGTALSVSSGGTFAGAINGTGSLGVTGGSLVLTGSSGYTGGTSIAGGTLQLGSGGATGSVTGPIAISAGGILALNLAATPVANAISGAGNVILLSSGTQVLSGPLSYTGSTAINSTALQISGANTDSIGSTTGTGSLIVGDGTTATSLTFGAVGSASGSITVNANSTLAIASTGSVLGNSGVTLNGGTLVAGNASATGNFGSGNVTVTSAGGTIQYTATSTNTGFNNAIAVGGPLTIDFHDSGATGRTFTYSGNGSVAGAGLTGSGTLSIVNTGTLAVDTFIFSNTNPAFTGNINIGGAGAGVRVEVTDPLATDTNILGTGAVNVAAGSQLWFNQGNVTNFANTFNIAGVGSAVDASPLGALRLQTGSNLTGTVNLAGDATISIGTNTSSTATLSGPITGAHTLTLKNGIYTFGAGTNAYGPGTAGSAATIIGPAATAILNTSGSLSSGGLQLAGGGVNLNGQNLTVNNLSSTAIGQTVTVTASTGTTNFVIANSLANVTAGDSVSGGGLPGNTIVTGTATQETPNGVVTVGSPTVTLNSIIGLEPGDTVSGIGVPAGTTILSLSGNAVTFSNNITAAPSNGTATTFTVATGNVIILSNSLPSTVTNAPLTILDGSVISNSGPSAATGSNTLTIGSDNSAQSFGGLIADGTAGRTIALVKNGSGAQTLTAANTYTGGTSVNGGALYVNNSAGTGTGSGVVTLNGGTLGGSGSVGAVVAGSAVHTINPGATGAGSVGTLTAASLITNANTTLSFDLTSPATTSDRLAITGALTLNGGKLAISSQSVTGAASLGYYKVLSYGSLTGGTANITLPAISNNIAYTLDSSHDAGFIDVHRGYIGDATDDGVVDLNDLNVVLNNLGVTTSSWNLGNFDGAATIDLNDLNSVLNNLGTSIPAGSALVSTAEALVAGEVTPAATPEPASLSLAVGGIATLLLRRRRHLV